MDEAAPRGPRRRGAGAGWTESADGRRRAEVSEGKACSPASWRSAARSSTSRSSGADAAGSARLTVRGPMVTPDAGHGDSIAVSGVCLTVVDRSADTFTVDVMAETLRRTTIGALRAGDPVNLERSVTSSTRLGGHLVQGHVDGTGVVDRPHAARALRRDPDRGRRRPRAVSRAQGSHCGRRHLADRHRRGGHRRTAPSSASGSSRRPGRRPPSARRRSAPG